MQNKSRIHNYSIISTAIPYILSKKFLLLKEIHYCLKALDNNLNLSLLQDIIEKLIVNKQIKLITYQQKNYYTTMGNDISILINEQQQQKQLQQQWQKLKSKKLLNIELTARLCYKHLAGIEGCKLYQHLLQNKLLLEENHNTTADNKKVNLLNNNYKITITAKGHLFFKTLNITNEPLKQPLKLCLDYSERQLHLGGSLAVKLSEYLLQHNFIKKDITSRGMIVTEKYQDFLNSIK